MNQNHELKVDTVTNLYTVLLPSTTKLWFPTAWHYLKQKSIL